MALMTVNLVLDRDASGELSHAIASDDAWKEATEHGLRESAVFVDPSDPTKVTVLTRWRNLEELRERGRDLSERLVQSLGTRGVEVIGTAESQVRVSPWRMETREGQ